MTKFNFTIKEFIKATHEVLRGIETDYIYPNSHRNEYDQAQYFLEDGSPSCLFGMVFSKFDITQRDLWEIIPDGVDKLNAKEMNFSCSPQVAIDTLLDYARVEEDNYEGFFVLRQCQSMQDECDKFGDILQYLEARIPYSSLN